MNILRTLVKALLSFAVTLLMVYLPSLYLETYLNIWVITGLAFIAIWVINFFVIDMGEPGGYFFEHSFAFPWGFEFNTLDEWGTMVFVTLFILVNVLFIAF